MDWTTSTLWHLSDMIEEELLRHRLPVAGYPGTTIEIRDYNSGEDYVMCSTVATFVTESLIDGSVAEEYLKEVSRSFACAILIGTIREAERRFSRVSVISDLGPFIAKKYDEFTEVGFRYQRAFE